MIKLNKGAELPRDAGLPTRVFVHFPNARLFFMPERKTLQIVAAGAVVSTRRGWEVKELKPYLFMVRRQNWQDFYWKINTATRRLYKARHGSKDEPIGTLIDTNQTGNRDETMTFRLEKTYIVFKATDGLFQLGARGAVLSYGEEWQVKQIGPKQYHLQRGGWGDFFWLIDTFLGHAYTVENGRFGQRGGRQRVLQARIETKD